MNIMKTCKYALCLIFMICMCFLTAICNVAAVEFSDVADSDNIVLTYDDRLELTVFSDIQIIDKGIPTSYKVGYGVKKNTKDDAVITVKNGKLHATGTGVALIELTDDSGKHIYKVTVKKAPISMFLLIGQSNMRGTEGSADQSIANEEGQVYSSYGPPAVLTVDNAAQYIPSALSGEKSSVNTVGGKDGVSYYPINSLTEAGRGKIGIDSGLAYEWNRMTGDKVWLVNAAHGGTSMQRWIDGKAEYEEAVAMFKAAQQVMAAEIAAGHYELKNYGYFWLQGCSDDTKTAEYYYNAFMSMHKSLKKELAFDLDGDGKKETLKFADIIMPRAGRDIRTGYREGNRSETTEYSFYQSYLDLEMRGQRVAQYYLCNQPDNDINLVSNISESWVYMPDGTNGVASYFKEHYPGGRVDYPVQVKQPEEWYTPTTPADVHDSIHYNQIGYNEVGIDAARNAAYTHGRAEKPEDIKTTVTFYNWTGYEELSSVSAKAIAQSGTLVVPVVYPVYESKSVTYKLSDEALSYDFYDLVADEGTGDGLTLTSYGADENKTVTVIGNAEKIHKSSHKLITVDATKATCTHYAYSEYIYCKTCDKAITQKYKTHPSLGHRFSDYIYNKDATYSSDGTETAVCKRCKGKKTVTASGTKLTLGRPSEITAAKKVNEIKLTWTKVKNADGYRVFIYKNGGWEKLKTTTARELTVTDLKPGVKYKFSVKAYVKEGKKVIWSPKRRTAEFYTKPASPSFVRTTITSTTITLKWPEVKNATGYRIYRYKDGWHSLKTTSDTSYKITSLLPGRTYTFAVRAYIKHSEGTIWGNYKKITVATKPSTPTVKLASSAEGRATVKWNDCGGESGYQIWYSSSAVGKYEKHSNCDANTLKAYVTGLKSGKTYYFKVRAYKKVENGCIYSSFSSPKSIKIK